MGKFNWSKEYRQQHKLKTAGVVTLLTGRYLYALMFTYAFTFKLTHKWMWTDALQKHYKQRLSELPKTSFHAKYLRYFAIPLYKPIAWFVTIGQASIAASTLTGTAVRANAAMGLFMLLNFVAGGFGNKTIGPFVFYSLVLMAFPTSDWIGFDKELRKRYPNAIWFK
jgi:thiosulfate dehydrogenase [quinone] large subunit